MSGSWSAPDNVWVLVSALLVMRYEELSPRMADQAQLNMGQKNTEETLCKELYIQKSERAFSWYPSFYRSFLRLQPFLSPQPAPSLTPMTTLTG